MGEIDEHAPVSLPPAQVAEVFLNRIESAEVAAHTSGRHRIVAEEGLQAADEVVSAAEEARRVAEAEVAAAKELESNANELVARWRQVARTSLEFCEGYPADVTLREQMRIDGRSEETAEVLADVAAANKYIRTEDDPVIVVVQQMPPFNSGQPDSAHNVIRFVSPRVSDQPALTITRSGMEHHARIAASRLYELNPDMRDDDKLIYDSDPMDQSVIGPIEDVLFVGNTKDVGTLFETEEFSLDALTHNNGDPIPSVVIYGDEAVELFTRLLGNGVKGLRPALYGTMLNLGKAYKGVGMYDVETQQSDPELVQAKVAFRTDLQEHIRQAIAPLPEDAEKEEHVLLSPDVQKFIGFSDDELADYVETYVEEHAWTLKTKLRDRDIAVRVGSNTRVGEAWESIWNSLGDKGFTDLAARMKDPVKTYSVVLSAEREALVRDLSPERSLNFDRSDRRAMRRALKAVDENLDSLEA